MPSAKKPAQPKKKSTPRRTLSVSHKRALAEGRSLSATVDRYLTALNAPKPRGRRVSPATLNKRLTDARASARTASGVDKVVAAQTVRDLERRLARLGATEAVDVKSLEAAFVKVAKTFGERRGIGYGAWRDAGVSAAVLKRAGVTRTRG